jgi:multiple antibiotic resistance protein
VSQLTHEFLQAFIPLFVAIDVIGLTPLYLTLAEKVPLAQRHSIAYQAVFTAFAVGVGFMFLGQFIFSALGITVADFQIAGGLILFALATRDLSLGKSRTTYPPGELGVVPLGLPLIAGPAMLATLLALVESLGVMVTLAALIANLGLVGVVLRFSDHLSRGVGLRALRALSRIVALLLATIAVHMIRRGWQAV